MFKEPLFIATTLLSIRQLGLARPYRIRRFRLSLHPNHHRRYRLSPGVIAKLGIVNSSK